MPHSTETFRERIKKAHEKRRLTPPPEVKKITLKEAAAILGLSYDILYRMYDKGILRGEILRKDASTNNPTVAIYIPCTELPIAFCAQSLRGKIINPDFIDWIDPIDPDNQAEADEIEKSYRYIDRAEAQRKKSQDEFLKGPKWEKVRTRAKERYYIDL